MDAPAPTPDEIFEKSKLKWRKLGYPSATDIEEQVAQALAYVSIVTGRYFDPASTYLPLMANYLEAPVALNSTGEALYLLAKQAVRMRTEQIVMQEQAAYIDTITDDAIQSFSAGPYSETRRDPTRRGEQKALNTWGGLNELLWLLMTGERYDYWVSNLTGTHTPDFVVEEVDWSLIGKSFPFGSAYSAVSSVPPWNDMWPN